MGQPQPDSAQTQQLLDLAQAGDPSACQRLLQRHRDELTAFVALRLDPRLRPRLDPSDVVQETQLEVLRRFEEFLRRRPMPFRLWLRRTAYERLLQLHRHHLQAERRSVRREAPWPERSSQVLAERLLAAASTPSQQLDRAEQMARLRRALGQLPAADRDLLLMRHQEGLSHEDAACILGITAAAARQRYGRALLRLHRLL